MFGRRFWDRCPPYGGFIGGPGEGGPSSGDFERWLKGAVEIGRLSVGAL